MAIWWKRERKERVHQMWKSHFSGWWMCKKPDTEALSQILSGRCLKTGVLHRTVLVPVLIVVNTSLRWPWWPPMRFKSKKLFACVCFKFQASFCLTWPDGYRFACLSICQPSHLFTVMLVWEKQTLSSTVLWDCEVLFWRCFFLISVLARVQRAEVPNETWISESSHWCPNFTADYSCSRPLPLSPCPCGGESYRAMDGEQETARDKMMWK